MPHRILKVSEHGMLDAYDATLKARGFKSDPAQRAAAQRENFGPETGWFKSWSITRSMLTGVCQVNGWNRIDSGARVREIELGWTGRGEFQPAPGNYEPHATVNNYASYPGRRMTVEPGKIAVLTGRLPTFPSTRNGEAVMTVGEVRYWSICGLTMTHYRPYLPPPFMELPILKFK